MNDPCCSERDSNAAVMAEMKKIANAFEWPGQPPTIAPSPWGICTVPWAHPSLHPKRHVDQFSRFCTVHHIVSHNFTMGHHISPKQLSIPFGRSYPPCNTWYLGPTRVIKPNGTSIGSAIFAWAQILCCQWGTKPQKLPLP